MLSTISTDVANPSEGYAIAFVAGIIPPIVLLPVLGLLLRFVVFLVHPITLITSVGSTAPILSILLIRIVRSASGGSSNRSLRRLALAAIARGVFIGLGITFHIIGMFEPALLLLSGFGCLTIIATYLIWR